MRRKGLMKGNGKGYKNVMGKDPMVHSQSAKGIKQPQRIKNIRMCDYDPKLNKYEEGDSTRISNEEPLYDTKGQRIDGVMGKILSIKDNVAEVKLDDQRIVEIGLGLLTAKQIVYQPIKMAKRYVSLWKYKVGGRAFKFKKEAIDWLKARHKLGYYPGVVEKIRR